jgi:hypothetical protein
MGESALRLVWGITAVVAGMASIGLVIMVAVEVVARIKRRR